MPTAPPISLSTIRERAHGTSRCWREPDSATWQIQVVDPGGPTGAELVLYDRQTRQYYVAHRTAAGPFSYTGGRREPGTTVVATASNEPRGRSRSGPAR
jgi:hypothetical protein